MYASSHNIPCLKISRPHLSIRSEFCFQQNLKPSFALENIFSEFWISLIFGFYIKFLQSLTYFWLFLARNAQKIVLCIRKHQSTVVFRLNPTLWDLWWGFYMHLRPSLQYPGKPFSISFASQVQLALLEQTRYSSCISSHPTVLF